MSTAQRDPTQSASYLRRASPRRLDLSSTVAPLKGMSHTERQFTPRDAVRTLRDWIAHLDSTDRLAVARESIPLEFTLTAVAKRRDGAKATMFPSPQGHEMAVVSGLLSQRDWIAEALGVDGTNSVSTLLRKL